MKVQPSLLFDTSLPARLHADIHRMNPWGVGDAMPPQPRTRRHLVQQIRRRLDSDIAPIVVVRGPRQVGKTTAQFQIIADLLSEGVPPSCILRVQFDELASLRGIQEPILTISDWFQRNITEKVLILSPKMAIKRTSFLMRCRTWSVGTRSSSHWWTTLQSRLSSRAVPL